MSEASTEPTRKVRYVPVPTPFVEAEWDDFKPGDELWYYINRGPGRQSIDSGIDYHGPFDVIDPAVGSIRNSSGVVLAFREAKRLVLLKRAEGVKCKAF